MLWYGHHSNGLNFRKPNKSSKRFAPSHAKKIHFYSKINCSTKFFRVAWLERYKISRYFIYYSGISKRSVQSILSTKTSDNQFKRHSIMRSSPSQGVSSGPKMVALHTKRFSSPWGLALHPCRSDDGIRHRKRVRIKR